LGEQGENSIVRLNIDYLICIKSLVFQAWKYLNANIETKDDPRTEPIFYNNNIEIGQKSFFVKIGIKEE
jgi:hypothetical protein